ncbi:MAG: hypothetical protein JNJ90_12515 [Saprospiraceae bacterium]|jgi:hypothetical protein|nr:hypothetical protein [Saprospiraceae bacterium]
MSRFDQIERYLQGHMAAEELQAFEAEMAANPELAALVRQHRLERHGLELLVERDLLAKMQAWDRETELFQQVQPRRAVVRPMTWVLRAAAVLALAALGYWLLRDDSASSTAPSAPIVRTQPEIKPRVPTVRKRQQPIPQREQMPENEPAEEIAQQTPSEPAPAPIEEMSPEDDLDYAALAGEFFRERDFVAPTSSKSGSASYDQTLKNFQDGKYNDIISKTSPDSGGDDAVGQKELLALAQYKSGRYTDAASTFRTIIAGGRQPYVQRAEWGLTLALLQELPTKKGQFYRALSDILRNPDHLFYTKAKRLEERL